MGYVNKFNRGIARVQEELIDNGNVEARFAVDKGTVFEVTIAEALVDTNITTQITTRKTTATQKEILEYLKEHPNAGRAEISMKLKTVTEYGVKYNLNVLQKKGLLTRIGPAKGGYWQINE